MTGAIVLGVIGSLIAAMIWQAAQQDDPGRTALLTVDNRVTDGPTEMREDTSALRLAREPSLDCLARPTCVVEGTEYFSGDRVEASCQTRGDRVTNGVDGDPADDDNPGLVDSALWYGIRHDGALTYVSEVWIERQSRGGVGLPDCE